MNLFRAWAVIARASDALLDTIMPPHERTARTNGRSLADIPLDPHPVHCGERTVLTLARYDEPAVSDLIRSLKYENSAHAAELAAQLLADFLAEEIANIRAWSTRPILIAPVPLYKTRERERGFNQIVRVLAQLPPELQDGTRARLAPKLLVRTRDTAAQAKLARPKRLANVAGAFALSPEADSADLSSTHAILIDDVVTTGATITHAAAPLLRSGAAVTLIALARA
ncbi:ComF family protein [Candidatus Kaiserbacteria bacterium]|nr:ComF family protein [Candidatus Kaiserbacteria bacterium]